jgi:hypothetical protein
MMLAKVVWGELPRTPSTRSSAYPSSDGAGDQLQPTPNAWRTVELDRDPDLLLLVDPVDASVGAPEVAIGVVHLLDASDLAQKLASGCRQFL